jgi:NADPH2:quinone reductase
MRAFVADTPGPRLSHIEVPAPGPGQLLLMVRAAALNRVDLNMSRGLLYGAAGGPGTILGRECAGTIVAIGDGVSDFAVGDRVMTSTPGAFAEYALADSARAYPIPDTLDFETAAVLPVSLSTGYNAVAMAGGLQAGDTLLVHGASTAMGLAAMQIAKLRGAGLVIATSRDAARRSRIREYGADVAIDPRSKDWVETIAIASGRRGADVVLDFVAGPSVNDLMLAARIGGRIVNVARMGGRTASFDFDRHALRRLTYVGVTFRTRTKAEIGQISAAVRRDLLPAVARGRLRMPIDRRFAFEDLPEALAHMQSDQHFGKILIRVGEH